MKRLFLILPLVIISFLITPEVYSEDDPRDSDNPFGVLDFLIWNHDWNYYHYDTVEKIEYSAKLMKEAGVGFVRMDFLWYDIEPKPGVFDFSRYDKIVDILNDNGIKILGILHYNPSWDNKPWNKAPRPILYTNYACKTVDHFKDRVKYWEIWNEPNDPEFWMPQDEMEAYSKLLKMVYPAIKRVDPSAKILVGGLTNTIDESLRRLYSRGCKNYFDIVNIHPFADPVSEDGASNIHNLYEDIRKTMKRYGDNNKKIWITEIGCPGIKKPSRRLSWWLGKGLNEEQQAEWVKKIYTECLKWENVDKVFWAFFRDTDRFFKSAVDYFGLISYDFKKKPSYRAYKKIAKKN